MTNWLNKTFKIASVIFGLLLFYLVINSTVIAVSNTVQGIRDDQVSASLLHSYVSEKPFGEQVTVVKRNTQIFYNLKVKRTKGEACYVRTSYRWLLHSDLGYNVMWNVDNGEFYAGDENENLAHAVQVPNSLIPGNYTFERLATFKCGSSSTYAKAVTIDELEVQ